MFHSSTSGQRPSNDSAAKLIQALESDENQFAQEQRSLDREKLVLPVTITTPDGELQIDAFSKNISDEGICLITPQPFRPKTQFAVRLMSEAQPQYLPADCQWNQSFGNSYWISGWRFGKIVDLHAIKSEDERADWENRAFNRRNLAVPFVIKQSNGIRRVNAFSKNISNIGVCLVSKDSVAINSACHLQAQRPNGETANIDATCVWTKQYQSSYWISGWEYKN